MRMRIARVTNSSFSSVTISAQPSFIFFTSRSKPAGPAAIKAVEAASASRPGLA